MRTVVGLYDEFDTAQRVAKDLSDTGFERDAISVIARDSEGEYARHIPGGKMGEKDVIADETTSGAAAGAGIGAAVGGLAGLLLGLGALTIPVVGPVIAAGPIAAALAGAGIGAAAGGLLGALTSMGVPEEHAELYSEGVRHGGTLVLISVEDQMAERAVEIMNRYNPVDIEKRKSTWQETGSHSSEEENKNKLFQTERKDEYKVHDEDRVPVTGSRTDDVTKPFVDEGKSFRTKREDDYEVHDRDRMPLTGSRTDDVTKPFSDEGKSFRAENENVYESHVEDRVPVTGSWTEDVTKPFVDEDVQNSYQGQNQGQGGQWQQDDWASYEPLYRQDFQTRYANRGQTFGNYMPAYRYGYELRNDQRYQKQDWYQVESEARSEWERRGEQNTWEDIKDAVHHAWESIKR